MSAWKARARQRPQRTGQMNRTEAAFAAYLEAERLGVTSPEPTIRSWRFEPFRLRLGDDWKTSYTPDFQVVLSSGEMVLVEVKAAKRDKRTGRWMAYWQEGSTEKFKWARQHFPEFHFVAVRPYGKGEAPGVEVDVFGLLPNLPWVALKI